MLTAEYLSEFASFIYALVVAWAIIKGLDL